MTEELLGRRSAASLVDALRAAEPDAEFGATRGTAERLEGLTLSERARALARSLLADVDGGPERLAALTRRALERPDFAGWALWPVGLAVATRAVDDGRPAAFDDAMAVLRALTPRMTSEFAIRPLLRHDLDRALAIMREWTADPDWNVRRLASEGSRPLLPWAERIPALVADPAPTRPILDALHDDPEESVRRSVANHLNDHSRSHAEFVVRTARAWREAGGAHVERTSRHALRTLVKRGDPGALALLGHGPVRVDVAPLELAARTIAFGDAVRFRGEVASAEDAPVDLVIDFVLFFPDARGRERSKVFKLAQRALEPGARTVVEGAHAFRPMTTRRYYPGRYGVALQVNGVRQERADFALTFDPPLE